MSGVKKPVTGPVGHGQGEGTGEHQPSCPLYQVEELLRKPDPGIMRVRAELEVEWWLRDARIPYGPDLVAVLGARVVEFLLADRIAQQDWETWLGPVARMAVRAYQDPSQLSRDELQRISRHVAQGFIASMGVPLHLFREVES